MKTVSRWIRARSVLILGLLVMLFLYLPNFVVAMLSVNEGGGRKGLTTNYNWTGFTTKYWTSVCSPGGLCDSLKASLWIGLVVMIAATALGTLAAYALVRYRFVGRSATNLVLFIPMATPDIVMGSSLLAMFIAFSVPLGYGTIIVAHVMFCLSYVVVTVKSRLAGMDDNLEQAAMDLYATESQAFWRITFPLIFPGILAASLLSFSLSFDDFIVTNLNAGSEVTFPMYVWGAALRGLPVQVNVVGTAMFLLAIVIVVTAEFVNSRRRVKAKV